MKIKLMLCSIAIIILLIPGCFHSNSRMLSTKTVTIYSDRSIPANTGISTGVYTSVDGYRYANITVEFEQNTANEEPVSLGVVFAHSQNGQLGSRRYFNFEQNFSAAADPQMITLSGKNSWHGAQQKKSSYTARLPIMGPFIQVFPFNHHSEARTVSVLVYLTE